MRLIGCRNTVATTAAAVFMGVTVYKFTYVRCLRLCSLTQCLSSPFSIHHPFLLADNRHYTFYVWRRVFMLHPIVPYLLIPGYIACTWAWYIRIGKNPVRSVVLSLIVKCPQDRTKPCFRICYCPCLSCLPSFPHHCSSHATSSFLTFCSELRWWTFLCTLSLERVSGMGRSTRRRCMCSCIASGQAWGGSCGSARIHIVEARKGRWTHKATRDGGTVDAVFGAS